HNTLPRTQAAARRIDASRIALWTKRPPLAPYASAAAMHTPVPMEPRFPFKSSVRGALAVAKYGHSARLARRCTWPLPTSGLAGLRAKLRLVIFQLEARRQNSSWAPKRDKDSPFSFLGVPYTRIEAALETSVQSRPAFRRRPMADTKWTIKGREFVNCNCS